MNDIRGVDIFIVPDLGREESFYFLSIWLSSEGANASSKRTIANK